MLLQQVRPTKLLRENTMGKRGRPNKNGVKPAWMLARALVALNAYRRARETGAKYEVALIAMVNEVHRRYPEMPMSRTQAKRVLAKYAARDQKITLGVGPEHVLEGNAARQYFQVWAELASDLEKRGRPIATRVPQTGKVRTIEFGFAPARRYPRVWPKDS